MLGINTETSIKKTAKFNLDGLLFWLLISALGPFRRCAVSLIILQAKDSYGSLTSHEENVIFISKSLALPLLLTVQRRTLQILLFATIF
jgi:hypothetical protein